MATLDKVYILFDGGDDVRLDCVTSIAPRHASEVTTNPVEPAKTSQGGQERTDVSDNARPSPKTLSLELFVSELVGQENFEAYDPDFMGDHIKIRERLELANDTGELLHIDLGADKGIYPNMLILELDPTWEPGKGKSLYATLQLQQITFANTKVRKIPPKSSKKAKNIFVSPKDRIYTQGGKGFDYGYKGPSPINAPKLDSQVVGATSFLDIPKGTDWVRGLPK